MKETTKQGSPMFIVFVYFFPGSIFLNEDFAFDSYLSMCLTFFSHGIALDHLFDYTYFITHSFVCQNTF